VSFNSCLLWCVDPVINQNPAIIGNYLANTYKNRFCSEGNRILGGFQKRKNRSEKTQTCFSREEGVELGFRGDVCRDVCCFLAFIVSQQCLSLCHQLQQRLQIVPYLEL
jgi:hypothetical protein